MNKRLPKQGDFVKLVGSEVPKSLRGRVFKVRKPKPFWYNGHVCTLVNNLRIPFRLTKNYDRNLRKGDK